MKRFTGALTQAGIEYGVIGGMAVFLHVNERDTMAARLTRDIDAAVERTDPVALSAVMKNRFVLLFSLGAFLYVAVESAIYVWMSSALP